MATIRCPECESEISEKASVCPKCGHPIANNENGFNEEQFTVLTCGKCEKKALNIIPNGGRNWMKITLLSLFFFVASIGIISSLGDDDVDVPAGVYIIGIVLPASYIVTALRKKNMLICKACGYKSYIDNKELRVLLKESTKSL